MLGIVHRNPFGQVLRIGFVVTLLAAAALMMVGGVLASVAGRALSDVVVITAMPGGRGYLMDLEFYGEDMPLGGLEFAISNILQACPKLTTLIFVGGLIFCFTMPNTPLTRISKSVPGASCYATSSAR